MQCAVRARKARAEYFHKTLEKRSRTRELKQQQAELKDHLTRYREHYSEIPTEQINSL